MPTNAGHLEVVHYPDPVLRKKAKPVAGVTDEIRALAERMVQLMYDEEGIGLAAPQVGVSLRLFVAHVPEGDGRSATAEPPTASAGPEVYINPVIAQPEGALEPLEEGCLSLPDIRGSVMRPPVVTITAMGLDGRTFTRRGAGLLARCWQHELDHLDGVLIIDKLSQMERLKLRKKIRALEG
jgi:peptide deformylase